MNDYAAVKLKGSYEIEQHLYSLNERSLGAWVDGETVVGNIKVHGETLECFTRPVYAYLAQCEWVQGTVSGSFVHSQQYQCGFSDWFYSEVTGAFEVSAGIDRVNALSGIVTGVSPRKLWAKPSAKSKAVSLSGQSYFSVYQMHMVYAHCLVSKSSKNIERSRALSSVFHAIDDQWVMLSSVGFDRVLAVNAAEAAEPQSWNAVKQKLLKDEAGNLARFDCIELGKPFNRYA